MVNETNNASEIVGEVVEGIPAKLQWYSDVLSAVEQILFDLLEKIGFDPFHFLFLAFILLLIVLSFLSKLKIGKWALWGIVIVLVLAWIL